VSCATVAINVDVVLEPPVAEHPSTSGPVTQIAAPFASNCQSLRVRGDGPVALIVP
jgi:hypothetical protein